MNLRRRGPAQVLRRLYCAISLIGLVAVAGALQAQVPAGIISTYAGGGILNQDGVLATNYQLDHPSDVAVDRLGNIYIADSQHHKVLKIDLTTQIVTTVAGTGTQGYNGDGILATSARLNNRLESLSTAPATFTSARPAMSESGG